VDISARRTRSIWVNDPPEDKLTSSPDPEPRSTDSDESGESGKASGNEGAFNPETGEINWDCSCLGGMAHGPCGPEFREAFSCFVFSEKEPKGVECVEKFKNMQDCFRRHPNVYGEGQSSYRVPYHTFLLIEYWAFRIR
jgi:mitochondrial intermembrane space import and assembly protein 40